MKRAHRGSALLALLLAGCLAHGGRAGRSGSAGPAAGAGETRTAVRYLALGDSYTIGEGVAEAERWPAQLVARLREGGRAAGDPLIVARTGWTTDELMAEIDGAAPEGRFDLVSLLIGVNDQYRGRDVEEFRAGFRALLRRAIGFAGGEAGRVIVLSIPDWGVTPFAGGRDRAAIAQAIDRFNAAGRDETRRAGARYVDVTAVSREAAGDATLLAADGLHPSGAMYAAWASLALPAARDAIGRPAP